jgi:ATP-dependent Zn protease
MMDKEYPASTAYHEAGHAVVACCLVLKVGHIHIDEQGEGGGAQIECADGLSIVEQIAVRVAGMKAQAMWNQKSALPLGQDDREKLAVLFSGLSDECHGEIYEKGSDLAVRLLEDHKDTVKRVAERLIKHGRLSGSDFATLMRGH